MEWERESSQWALGSEEGALIPAGGDPSRPGTAAPSGAGAGCLVSPAPWAQLCGISAGIHAEFLPGRGAGLRKAMPSWTTVPSATTLPRDLPLSSPDWVSGVGFCRLDHLCLLLVYHTPRSISSFPSLPPLPVGTWMLDPSLLPRFPPCPRPG